MSTNPIRLQYLFDRYVHNTCTPDEWKEFWQLAGELSEEDPMSDDIKKLWDSRKPTLYSLNAEEGKVLYKRIMEKAGALEIDYSHIGHLRNRSNRVWGAVAACMAGLIIIGGSYLFRSKPGQVKINEMAPIVSHDARPGGNKAMLTLGNGSRITLEGTTRGQLARQGGAEVLQTDSGRLAYKPIHNTESKDILSNTLSTPRGGKYALKLADGTEVWLNSASSITYPTAFTGPERRVAITGEAYFKVARNAAQTFHVSVNGIDVEVLGTDFNINAYSNEATIKTTLLTGSVKVTKGASARILKPGQQAQASVNDGQVRITDADMDLEMAWKNNEFYFKNADLQTVMRQLSRWYDLDIFYQTGAPLNRRFEGEIPMDAMASQVLSILEKNGVRFILEGNKLTVLP